MFNEEVNDTDPEIERMMIEFWRTAPAWRKLRQVSMLNEMLDSLVRADIVQHHPNAGEAEIRRRLLKRRLPPDVYAELIGGAD